MGSLRLPSTDARVCAGSTPASRGCGTSAEDGAAPRSREPHLLRDKPSVLARGAEPPYKERLWDAHVSGAASRADEAEGPQAPALEVLVVSLPVAGRDSCTAVSREADGVAVRVVDPQGSVRARTLPRLDRNPRGADSPEVSVRCVLRAVFCGRCVMDMALWLP